MVYTGPAKESTAILCQWISSLVYREPVAKILEHPQVKAWGNGAGKVRCQVHNMFAISLRTE